MRHETQIDILQRCLARLETRGTDLAETSSNPVENYVSPERLRREKETLFRKFPLVVGFSSKVAQPGDFFTHDLTEVPILVSRDREGRLRAFMNVCRHRGNLLVREPSGSGRHTFSCSFHGWCYESTGRLQSVAFPGCFPDLDKESLPLVPLAVAERYGLVFVLPTPGLTFDIDRYLGPLARDLETFGFDRWAASHPSMSHRRMNWKLQMDTSLESYHFSFLHPTTGGLNFLPNLTIADWEYPNCRLVVLQKSAAKVAGTDPAGWKLTEHAGLLYSIFPNTCVFYNNGFAWVLSAFPVDADTTILRGAMLAPEGPITPQETLARKNANTFYWATMEEDVAVGVACQTTLRSGANKDLMFGRSEYILGRYHAAVEDAVSGRLSMDSFSTPR